MADPPPFLPYSDSELVLGLVAPAGTNLDEFESAVETVLKEFRYSVNHVRLSDLACDVLDRSPAGEGTELERIKRKMDLGNEAREKYGGDVLALAATARINNDRVVGEDGKRGPLRRTAHLLRSLKHPGEVSTLRRIYGPGFFLIGVVASKEARQAYLRDRKGCTDENALHDLLDRDEHEIGRELGQRTRDTFHLSDVFIPLEGSGSLRRFFDLVFGEPCTTPTADEYAMFMAFAAALRSADLSRQVGAVIATANGDVVALGANDVPKPHGGLYGPEDGEHRDHVLGYDSNQRLRGEIIDEVLDRVRPPPIGAEAWRDVCRKRLEEAGAKDLPDDVLDRLRPEPESTEGWRIQGRDKLKGAKVMDITEYGRPVHAEMEALLSCARSGVSPKGGTLYSTTFPCHNCAKHILAAGIRRVVYVEPYPKSHAIDLYPKGILPGPAPNPDDLIVFEAFQGVGPRRFFDLFSLDLSTGYPVKRKDRDGMLRMWQPASAEARVALLPTSYIVREEAAAARLVTLKEGGPK